MKRHQLTLCSLVICCAMAIVPAIGRALNPEITAAAPNPASPSPSAQPLTVSGRNFVDCLTLSVTAPSGAVATYRDNAVTDRRETSFQASVVLAAAGTYSLVVVNPDGQASSPFSLIVKAAAVAPTVTAIKPAELTKSQTPQVLTIEGTRFSPGLSVMVTDPAGTVQTLAGSAIGQVSPTSVQATVALELAGDYELVVTNPTGGVSNSFPFKVGARK